MNTRILGALVLRLVERCGEAVTTASLRAASPSAPIPESSPLGKVHSVQAGGRGLLRRLAPPAQPGARAAPGALLRLHDPRASGAATRRWIPLPEVKRALEEARESALHEYDQAGPAVLEAVFGDFARHLRAAFESRERLRTLHAQLSQYRAALLLPPSSRF